VLVIAALLFAPWKAFLDRQVDEAPPTAAPSASGLAAAPAGPGRRRPGRAAQRHDLVRSVQRRVRRR
jgi:hypothetical protein